MKGIFSMYLGKTTGYRLLLYPLDEEENIVISNESDFYTIAVCVEIIEVSKHYEISIETITRCTGRAWSSPSWYLRRGTLCHLWYL